MKTLTRDRQDGLWDKFWDEMNQEWFKIEVLQDYTGEDDGPSLRAWKKGDRNRSIELLKTDEDPEFTSDCHKKISQGVILYRIHIVDEPLTQYVEWEMKYYEHVSMRLRGEQVFIARKSDLNDMELPPGDVMIFDGRRVIVNSYDQNGLMEQADFYDENDNISHFLELRKTLKSLARPIRI